MEDTKKVDYQSENNQLLLLHLQRQTRKLKQSNNEESSSFIKVIKKQIVQEKDAKPYGEIYLNTVIYDKRDQSTKHNNITLAQFLHQNPKHFQFKPMSSNIESILITTYGYDHQVFQPLMRSKVPFFIVNREGDNKQGFVKRNVDGFSNVTLISPPKTNFGYGVFHTKLWMIKFKSFLRIIICTSNNHLADWAIWQNAYWYRDLPLIEPKQKKQTEQNQQKSQKHEPKNQQTAKLIDFDFEKDFKQTLQWVIKQLQPQGIDIFKEIKIDLNLYDFKGINVILIPSFPGRFKGTYLDKVGISKLKKIMTKLNKPFTKPILTYNCTSLGKPDQKFIRQLYFAFNPSKFKFSPDLFRLVYPTERYIRQQTCGQSQVLFLTKENYEKCDLKGHIFHRYEQSTHNGVLGGIPHLKTIIITEGEQQNDRCVLYLGSHNFTRAAWGNYEKSTPISIQMKPKFLAVIHSLDYYFLIIARKICYNGFLIDFHPQSILLEISHFLEIQNDPVYKFINSFYTSKKYEREASKINSRLAKHRYNYFDEHEKLTLGIRQKQTQQKLNNNPLIYIFVQADIKILKQIIEITLNNAQIMLDSSVDLNGSKIVLKQQIFFYNEDSRSFDKINRFQEDVDFKKMQSETYYRKCVQKTKVIRKHHQKAQKFADEKRGLLAQINQLRKQKNQFSLEKEKFRKQLLVANAISNCRNLAKSIAQYESKLKDSKNEIISLKKTIQQMQRSYSKLSNHLDQNILKKDYDHMKSTLQNQIQAKQSIFSKMVILQNKLEEYMKR